MKVDDEAESCFKLDVIEKKASGEQAPLEGTLRL
jgi:hypothetical protein